MIDWLTIIVALVIISGLVGFFGFFAWKLNESEDQQIMTIESQPEKKKKRKEQKKPKRETKDEEIKQQNQTEETEEESEQDSSSATQQVKNRKRQKNKSNVVVVNPVERPTPTVQPKVKTQPIKVVPPTKATTKATAIVHREENHDEEQPFTVVGPTRNKTNSTTKTNQVVNTTVEAAAPPRPTPPVPVPVPITKQVNGTSTPPPPVVQPKIADLIKTLPSSKVVVSELMIALDAFALSSDELDLIVHKISNKKAILKPGQIVVSSANGDNSEQIRRLNDLLKEKDRLIETALNNVEANQVQHRLMQEQFCKISLQNGELEKKIKRLENLVEEKEKRFKDLENENEKLKREDIVHVEPQPNELTAEQREKLENEISELKILTKQIEKNFVEIFSEEISLENSAEIQRSFSSLRNHVESTKRQADEQIVTLTKENEKLRQNMTEVENQLKDIEQLVQTKEDLLVVELKSRDEKIANILNENETLTGEINRLRTELERVQSTYETSVNEIRSLKAQIDERFLVAANTPPVVNDESFELIKQSPPSSSPIVIDMRAEQLNELIRSSKEALENQDSLTEQLDRHLDDMNRTSGIGSTDDENNATSSNQQ